MQVHLLILCYPRSMASYKRHEKNAAELALALRLLLRRMRSEAGTDAAAQQLTWAQLAVLRRLDYEGSATTAELARAENMKPQSMGGTISELEKLDLVERHPHETDGRQMIIRLTEAGAAMRKSTKDARVSWLAQSIAGLKAEDQSNITMAISLLKQLAES